jgi:hypothetical protein
LCYSLRLEESYGSGEVDEAEEAGLERKPEDWRRVFEGNCDDDFKLGMALTPGQVKTYALRRMRSIVAKAWIPSDRRLGCLSHGHSYSWQKHHQSSITKSPLPPQS